jgi:hypothetical protein
MKKILTTLPLIFGLFLILTSCNKEDDNLIVKNNNTVTYSVNFIATPSCQATVNGGIVGNHLTLKTGDNFYIKTTPNTWYPTNGGYPQTDNSSLTVWIDNQIVYQKEGNSSHTFQKTF